MDIGPEDSLILGAEYSYRLVATAESVAFRDRPIGLSSSSSDNLSRARGHAQHRWYVEWPFAYEYFVSRAHQGRARKLRAQGEFQFGLSLVLDFDYGAVAPNSGRTHVSDLRLDCPDLEVFVPRFCTLEADFEIMAGRSADGNLPLGHLGVNVTVHGFLGRREIMESTGFFQADGAGRVLAVPGRGRLASTLTAHQQTANQLDRLDREHALYNTPYTRTPAPDHQGLSIDPEDYERRRRERERRMYSTYGTPTLPMYSGRGERERRIYATPMNVQSLPHSVEASVNPVEDWHEATGDEDDPAED
jgi:hypothetical protein